MIWGAIGHLSELFVGDHNEDSRLHLMLPPSPSYPLSLTLPPFPPLPPLRLSLFSHTKFSPSLHLSFLLSPSLSLSWITHPGTLPFLPAVSPY